MCDDGSVTLIEADASFADRLRHFAPSQGLAIGIEHEFVLKDSGDQVVRFEPILRSSSPGRTLDPGDPNAQRLPSGIVVTCDQREAEVATVPIEVGPHITTEIKRETRLASGELERILPDGITAQGLSTHISVTADNALVERACLLFARTFSTSLMLLMDASHSPGLLVRPRPSRAEFGGEYLTGDQLSAAAVFATGAYMACEEAVRSSHVDGLPPVLELHTEAARERFGIYVDRQAVGADLYTTGRATQIRTVDGLVRSAQNQLEDCWKLAASQLDGLVAQHDLALTEEFVTGERRISLELVHDHSLAGSASSRRSPLGDLLTPRARGDMGVAPVVATWDLTCFALTGPRRGYAVVPRRLLAEFLAQLDAGRLDGALRSYLSQPSTGRVIPRWATSEPAVGLYDRLPTDLRGLVAPERDLTGVRVMSDTGEPANTANPYTTSDVSRSTATSSTQDPARLRTRPRRPGKSPRPEPEEPVQTSGHTPIASPRRWLLVALAVAAVIAAIVAVVILSASDDPEPVDTATPPTEQLTSGTQPASEAAAPLGLEALGVPAAGAPPATGDPRGDPILEQSGSAAGGPTAGTDIVAHVALTATASQEIADRLFGSTAYPCGVVTDDYRVICPFGAGPVPAGDLLMVAVQIDAGVAPTGDNYLYGLFLDADPAVANHRADPAFDWDFRQGTDQWYFLQMSADPTEDFVVANRANDQVQGQAMYSAATVIILEDTIVWVIPGDEIPDPAPSYRVSALRSSEPFDQQRDPSLSAGDVSGSDPTMPLTAITAAVGALQISDAIPPDVDGGAARPTSGPGDTDPTAFILDVLVSDFAERMNNIDATADPAEVAREILHPLAVSASGIQACADLTTQSYQQLTGYRIVGPVLGPDPTTVLALYTVRVEYVFGAERFEFTETVALDPTGRFRIFTLCGP